MKMIVDGVCAYIIAHREMFVNGFIFQIYIESCEKCRFFRFIYNSYTFAHAYARTNFRFLSVLAPFVTTEASL